MPPAPSKCLPLRTVLAALPAGSGLVEFPPGPLPARSPRRTSALLRNRTFALLLGDFLYQLARLLVVTLPCDISLRDDTDELAVFFDHGETAHVVLGHDSQRFIEILLRIDRDNLLGRYVANLDLTGISPLSYDANCDIAVGEHPDQLVALDNRCEADILVPHHFRRVRNGF